MTRKGFSPTDPAVLRRFARLMQIHLLTHPERIARRHGFTAEYVRRQWRHLTIENMDALALKIERLLDD